MFRIVSIKKVTRKHTRTIEQNKWWNLYLISDNYERDTKFISYIAKKHFCEDWIKISHPGGEMRFIITFTNEENFNKCVKFLGRCHLYNKNLGS